MLSQWTYVEASAKIARHQAVNDVIAGDITSASGVIKQPAGFIDKPDINPNGKASEESLTLDETVVSTFAVSYFCLHAFSPTPPMAPLKLPPPKQELEYSLLASDYI